MDAEAVGLPRLQLQFLLEVLHALIHLLVLELVHFYVVALVLVLLLQFLDFLFADVDLVLILLHLQARLLIDLALVVRHVVQLLPELLDVLGLRVVDVGLSGDLLLGRLDVSLGVLVLLSPLLVAFAAFGELDLDVLERVLKFLVLNLCQAEHLSTLFFSALAAIRAQALSRSGLRRIRVM